MQANVMTPEHPDWEAFCDLLAGPEGCDFKNTDNPDETAWKCDKSSERPLTRGILAKHFPRIDVEKTLAFFDQRGGYCDCEVIWNVEDSVVQGPD